MSDLHTDAAEGRLDPRQAAVYQRLAVDAESPDPPPGLAAATVARAMASLPTRARPRLRGELVFPVWLRPADTAVAAGIGFLVVGLVVAGVGKLRAERDALACQDRLRMVGQALDGYGDTHGGRFPQVGTPSVPVAGAFTTELVRAGQLPVDGPMTCPTAEGPAVGFAYTLGYRTPAGGLLGVRRADATDWTPVAADLPGVVPHARGWNLLSVDGSVRFISTPVVNGDDIFRNDAGLVRAGLHRGDTSLGGPADYP
jgi:hypothetical protein